MYDIIIIGCGPAGMTAAIYALRAGKKVLILEKETIGGAIASSPLIENYPGYIQISGTELANNLYDQVLKLGGEIELEEVQKIEVGATKKVITEYNTYKTKAIIIATGSKYRQIGLPNEEELIGNGIHFCVACDGAFYEGKTVCVIGGGNSAITNAMMLKDIAKKVYIIQNLADLTGEKMLCDELKKAKNVTIYYNSVVTQINGEDELESIVIDNDGEEVEIKTDGMFVSIGQIPSSDFVKGVLNLSKDKYIESMECKTSIPGIFVAGDVRDKKIRQLTTSVNDGTIAALEAIDYLDNK